MTIKFKRLVTKQSKGAGLLDQVVRFVKRTGRAPAAGEIPGVAVGEPLTGDAAKQRLLAELAADGDEASEELLAELIVEQLVSALRQEHRARGLPRRGRLVARFAQAPLDSANALVAEFTAGDGGGWDVDAQPDASGTYEVQLITPASELDESLLETLSRNMVSLARDVGCPYPTLSLL